MGSFSQMSHILLNHVSLQQLQIVTFSFLQLSGTQHLCVYRFIIQNLMNTSNGYLQKFMSQFYDICHSFMTKTYIFPHEILQEDLLVRKVCYSLFLFLISHIFPWMNKFFITENIFLPNQTGKLQVSAVYLPKLSALNTSGIKILPKECLQSSNYVVN